MLCFALVARRLRRRRGGTGRRRRRPAPRGDRRRQRVRARGCESVEPPAPKDDRRDRRPRRRSWTPSKTYVATVSTTCGDFEITLDAKRAPITGGSFKYLADQQFFDGTSFHRDRAGLRDPGRRPGRRRHGRPRLLASWRRPTRTSSTRRASSRWPRPAPSPPARRAGSSSSSPAPRPRAAAGLRAARQGHRGHGRRRRRSASIQADPNTGSPPPRSIIKSVTVEES